MHSCCLTGKLNGNMVLPRKALFGCASIYEYRIAGNFRWLKFPFNSKKHVWMKFSGFWGLLFFRPGINWTCISAPPHGRVMRNILLLVASSIVALMVAGLITSTRGPQWRLKKTKKNHEGCKGALPIARLMNLELFLSVRLKCSSSLVLHEITKKNYLLKISSYTVYLFIYGIHSYTGENSSKRKNLRIRQDMLLV